MIASDSAPATVLVVDDSSTVRLSLRDLLVDEGYEVLLAENGVDGLQLLRTERVDVLVLDLVMPEKDGADVLREIRTDDTLAAIPIVLLTATTDRKELVACLDMGADDFIVKPWDNHELLGRLRSMVRLKRALNSATNSEAHARALLNAPSDVSILIDPNGMVLACNEPAADMLATPVTELEGKCLFDLLPSARHDAWRRHTDSAIRTPSSIRFEDEHDSMFFHTCIYPVGAEQGAATGAAIVCSNITERKHAAAELDRLHSKLLESSRRAGIAEVATNVLHNVGNALNSINISATILADRIRTSKLSGLKKAVDLMHRHAEDLGSFISEDERGKKLPNYLGTLAGHLTAEQTALLKELAALTKNVGYIRNIVSAQQSQAGTSGVVESVSICDVVNNALTINATSFERYQINLVREYTELPLIDLDKQELLDVMVNLIRNAKHALLDGATQHKQLIIRIGILGDDRVRIEVIDNGIGIAKEDITRIYAHGFTTKKNGHGFGLHSSALSATEMGGSLTAHSDGPNQGATFALDLPLDREAGNGKSSNTQAKHRAKRSEAGSMARI